MSHRVTTVTAPAGYGKSVWVSSLLKNRDCPPTAWLSLDTHDSDPSFLLYHLIHSIKRVVPGFGDNSLHTMNSLEDVGSDWQIALSSIIEEIPVDKDLVLVMDDLYLIENNPVTCRILEQLIRWMPASTRLVLISRSKPPLKLYRKQLSGEFLEIDGNQLKFSLEETGELLSLMGLKPTDSDIEMIHARTEGWAAALRLLGTLLSRRGGDPGKTLSDLTQKDADLYNYLNNELMEFLPDDQREFLLDSSLLPYIETGLCNAVLNCSDSVEKINRLHYQGLLSRVEGETVSWRLHHLMEEFLNQNVSRLRSPDYIAAIRHRTASFLAEKGDIDRALDQLISCPDWQASAQLIVDHGNEHFVQGGRLDSLNSCLSRLPEDIINSNHRLLYFKGISIMHTDPGEATAILSKAADLAEEKKDYRGLIRSLMALVILYTHSNNAEKLKETAGRIQAAASLSNDSWSKGILLVSGLGQAVSEDRLKHGIRLSSMAGKIDLDPECQMYYLIYSGILQYRLGNMAGAKQLIDKALALPYVRDSDRWTGTAYELLSGIYCEMGEYGKAAEISRELLRLGHKYYIPHQTAYGHRRLAQIYLREGNLAEGRRQYQLSKELWLEAGNIFMAYVIDLEINLIRCADGENPRVLLEEIRKPLDKILANSTGQGYKDYALSLAGVIAREAGELDEARRWLEESAASSAGKGARQLLAGTLLHLARLHLLEGEEKKADNNLRNALGIAGAANLETFWDWHGETVYIMCRRALLKKIHPAWAVRILKSRFPERTCREGGSLLLYPDRDVRKSISSLIDDVVRETGSTVIHVNCLGNFRVFVNGAEINRGRWKTKKAENLFKYLVFYRNQNTGGNFCRTIYMMTGPPNRGRRCTGSTSGPCRGWPAFTGHRDRSPPPYRPGTNTWPWSRPTRLYAGRQWRCFAGWARNSKPSPCTSLLPISCPGSIMRSHLRKPAACMKKFVAVNSMRRYFPVLYHKIFRS
ncbi:MAG: hypothetical protein ACOY31_12015 [Bacillota bacterium]